MISPDSTLKFDSVMYLIVKYVLLFCLACKKEIILLEKAISFWANQSHLSIPHYVLLTEFNTSRD